MTTTTQFHTETLGNPGAPVLVMLHGWGQTLLSLKPFGELLSKDYQVVLVDLPGFGKSPAPQEVWDSTAYAHALVQHLESKGIKNFDLLGHSFGGRVSLRLAAYYPERVSRLILMASHGLPTPRPLKSRLRLKVLGWLRSFLKIVDASVGTKLFESWFVPRFASKDYQQAGILRGIFVKLVTEDASSDVAKIKAPTLMLWGQDDTETPVELGQRIKALLQKAEMYVFPLHDHHPYSNAGHHLLTRYVLDFKARYA